MATKTGAESASWSVVCTCGVELDHGTGPAPTQGEAEQRDHGRQHMAEATMGVHRLQVIVKGRITERAVDTARKIK